jgi:Spy/CpxP family protein refolding chaperone
MKKYIMLVAFAAFAVAANAQPSDEHGNGKRGGHGGGFERNFTDEQKACMEKAACPEMARPKEGEKPDGEKPDEAAMKESRECRQKAMADCGIEMPERPERQGGPENGRRNRDRDGDSQS